jgi:site-specific DNA-methyltransferase (adenine-specific)
MADKTAHEALPDDVTDAQIRGMVKKWLYDRDWTMSGISDVTIPVRKGCEDDIPISTYQDFESWMGRQLDDFLDYRDDNGGKSRWVEVFTDYYESDEQIREDIHDKVEIVGPDAEGSEQVSPETHGTKHDDEEEGTEEVKGGRFKELREVGIVDSNMQVDYGKLRGSMIHFANDAEEIVGTSEEANAREFREAFMIYMKDKFDGEWLHLTLDLLGPDEMQENVDWVWERKDEFVETVEDKWAVEPEAMEGNSDQESSSEGDEDDGVDNPSGISDWAESEGKAEDATSKENGHKEEEEEETNPEGISDWADAVGVDDEEKEKDTVTGRTRRDITVDKSADRELKRNHIYHENCYVALEKMPKNSVDCVVTSPPYYDLRDYHGVDSTRIGGDPNCDHTVNVKNECPDCGAWFGQLGNEPEPEMFIDNIVSLMKRIDRVLKPSGTLFLNIGDTYAKSQRGGKDNRYSVPGKSMMMVPERIALKMMDHGWMMRNRIVWAKQVMFEDKTVQGNANPCSFTDRLNYTDEPLFFFTHNKDYFFDLDSIRREHQTEGKAKKEYTGSKFNEDEIDDENIGGAGARAGREGYEPSFYHDEGANLPSVWQINPGKCGDLHTAVFSERLPADPIEAGCPEEVCKMCGKPLADGERFCSCPTEETEPGVVMDPFTGRGTTLKVALEKGRDYVGIEASDEYIEIARDYVPDTRQQKLL